MQTPLLAAGALPGPRRAPEPGPERPELEPPLHEPSEPLPQELPERRDPPYHPDAPPPPAPPPSPEIAPPMGSRGAAAGRAGAGPPAGIRARWEHFPHDADVGVRGPGRTREEAFEQAARALTAVVADPRGVRAQVPARFEIEAPDDDLLLYRWLNALVARMATRGMLFSRFRLEPTAAGLRAEALGETVEPARHRPRAEVKGATFTELAVRRRPDGAWLAQCVVDV